MDINEIWSKALEIIRTTINSAVAYNVYIVQTTAVSFTDSVFTISVLLALSKTMIDCRYRGCIESALERVTQKKYTLNIVVEGEQTEEIKEPKPRQEEFDAGSVNPKYTFENFVIGSSNHLATAAAISATENPGYIYNPLFLYGNSGLGKTHLMQAMGNKIKANHPEFKIIYVSSEQFMNEFVESIKLNTTTKFKKKYRSADVFLIDDVQFLENKEGLQEEVFHTFNDLYSRNKQIVLTSDRKPSELITLEDRLRNRFGQGLTIDIAVPNFETRVAILKKKAEEHNSHIPDEILRYIAKEIKSNVRELEGALNKIISMSELSHDEITIQVAEEVIKSLLPTGGVVKITPDKIMDKVAVYYGITKDQILGKSKTKNIALPRQVAMYLCSKLTDMNFVMIGKSFGGKDRTTAMHNIKKIEAGIKTNETLNSDINYIIKDLKSM